MAKLSSTSGPTESSKTALRNYLSARRTNVWVAKPTPRKYSGLDYHVDISTTKD